MYLFVASQTIVGTENVGVTVTQGTATGTLKTALNGDITSLVIQSTSGTSFDSTSNVVVGTTTVLGTNINTADPTDSAATSITIETFSR